MPMFREPCPLHQGEEQSDTELFLRAIPFYIMLLIEVVGKRREMWIEGRGGGIDQSSITGFR